MDKRMERILPLVQKPGRYTGGEYGEIQKDLSQVDLRMALCFPDVYEIGMSNTGMRILYRVLNDMPGVWCERVFAPWFDMAAEMKKNSIPLYALESGDSLDRFDAIGFSLGYEMAYTTVLEMLSLAGIPLRSADRPGLTPLVFAGGSVCCNSEPMADFFDLTVIGEGEEVDAELLELLRRAKNEGWSKPQFLAAAARIDGIYVPSLYTPEYNDDGTLADMRPAEGAPQRVVKRIVEDFENSCFPIDAIVPNTEIVHDRVGLELFRGCIRGCRFCQAGHIYRPIRSRSVEKLLEQGKEALAFSGYQEITLLSLSSSDYRGLNELCDGLMDYCEPRGIGLSLPSLRADNFSMDIMQRVQKVRKSGLTFAPEAGTQRLRDVINKNVTEEDLMRSCATAFQGGWNGIKLYFMLGLPKLPQPEPGSAGDGEHLLLRAQASHALPVGAAGDGGGIPAPGPSAAGSYEGQGCHLQLARRGNLLYRGGAVTGRPAAGCAAGGDLAPGRISGILVRGFPPGPLDGKRRQAGAGSALLRQPGAVVGRASPLGSPVHGCGKAAFSPGVPAGPQGRAVPGLPGRLFRLRCQGDAEGGQMRWISCASCTPRPAGPGGSLTSMPCGPCSGP